MTSVFVTLLRKECEVTHNSWLGKKESSISLSMSLFTVPRLPLARSHSIDSTHSSAVQAEDSSAEPTMGFAFPHHRL